MKISSEIVDEILPTLKFVSSNCDNAQFLYLGVANRRYIEHTEGRKKGKEARTRSLQLIYVAPAPRRCLIGKA